MNKDQDLYRKNPRFLVFRNVLSEHLDELAEAPSKTILRQIIDNIFQSYVSSLRNNKDALAASNRVTIFEDWVLNVYRFARKHGWSKEKISCLVDIAYETLHCSMEKRLDEHRSFELFKELLLRHGLFRPPHSINTYSLEEIKLIIEFYQTAFFRNYNFFVKAYQPEVDYELVPFKMFGQRFPRILDITDGDFLNKDDIPALDTYNKDKEIKLTPEELQEIMEGRSVHDIPEAKRKEIIKKQLELQKKAKVEKYLKKELAMLEEKMQEKMKLQDQEFATRLQALTTKKK